MKRTEPSTIRRHSRHCCAAVVGLGASVTSYAGYAELSDRLRTLRLSEDQDADPPIWRWKYGDLRIDVMPLEEQILGFSNKWYREAIVTAEVLALKDVETILARMQKIAKT